MESSVNKRNVYVEFLLKNVLSPLSHILLFFIFLLSISYVTNQAYLLKNNNELNYPGRLIVLNDHPESNITIIAPKEIPEVDDDLYDSDYVLSDPDDDYWVGEIPKEPYVHVNCTGEYKGKTIILKGGANDFIFNWNPLIQELEKSNRVCVFENEASPFTTAEINQNIENFKIVLDKSKELKPFIFVGKDFGSLFISEYVDQHKQDVQKVVLINPIEKRPNISLKNRWNKLSSNFGYFHLLKYSSFYQKSFTRLSNDEDPNEEVKVLISHILNNPRYWKMIENESNSFESLFEKLKKLSIEIPTEIITKETSEPQIFKSIFKNAKIHLNTEETQKIANLILQ